MKLTAFSLKKICILTLIRNCHCMNLTILPREVTLEIMEAIRDPEYGEYKVTIRHAYGNSVVVWIGSHVTEFLRRNDPQSSLLHYYSRGSNEYCNLWNYRQSHTHGLDILRESNGILYDGIRDVYYQARYTYTHESHSFVVYCCLEEQLPTKLVTQLEEQRMISPPIIVLYSALKPIEK